jgi:DNA-binding response OmpR family regulator
MGKKILLIDRVVCARHVVRRGLEHIGHTVYEASSVADGFAMLQREQIELVIMDLMLLEVSGFDLLERCLKHMDLPAFAMTTALEESILKKAVTAGFKEVLCKPLNFEHVNSLITKHCTSAGGERHVSVQTRIPQSVFDAAKAAAISAKVPLEDFVCELLKKALKSDSGEAQTEAQSESQPAAQIEAQPEEAAVGV